MTREEHVEQQSSQAHIARQPIVDRARTVVGYELLFKDLLGAASTGFQGQGSRATARILANSLLGEGLESLVGDVPAWIPVAEQLIVDGISELLAPEQFVLEIRTDVRPQPPVLEGCRRLRAAGFHVALDAGGQPDRLRAFRGCFDVVKVDWLATPAPALAAIVAAGNQLGVPLLAARLQSEADLTRVAAVGFSLFQGYAIGLPLTLQRRAVHGLSSQTLRLLSVINAGDFDYAQAAAIVEMDPALTFKILAFANSAFAAQAQRVNSIPQALVLFGERNLRRAVLIVFLAQTTGAAPSFALVEALVAGLFSEALARIAGQPELANVCLLAATLSHMDRLLGVPMAEVLERVPVDAVVQAALTDGSGPVGPFVQLTRAFQAGDWGQTGALVEQLSLSEETLQLLYRRAVVSAEQLTHGDTVARARGAA
jgi:EAL and modified HD-GYP domain-containing signal transduction protein